MLFEFVQYGDVFALPDGFERRVFRHHGQTLLRHRQIDDGLRIIANNLLFRIQFVPVPELLQVFITAGNAGHFYPGGIVQAFGQIIADTLQLALRANQ